MELGKVHGCLKPLKIQMNYFHKLIMDEEKSIFTTCKNNETEFLPPSGSKKDDSINGGSNIGHRSVFSPLAPPFQSRINGDLLSVTLQEPQVGDTAPSSLDFDLMNLRISDSDSVFGDRAEQNSHNYFMGARSESVASAGSLFSENVINSTNKNNEIHDNSSLDFFIKMFSSANTCVSMLTREQTMVLQSIRPGLLYELLQEIVRVRNDKRLPRALPFECAFCKNNGENEENYASHVLKDFKGRVQCPVLRAFRCPRCGATGDRAHTIKYCPINDTGMERQEFLMRRRLSSNSFVFGEGSRASNGASSSNRALSPSATSHSSSTSFWSRFGMN